MPHYDTRLLESELNPHRQLAVPRDLLVTPVTCS